MSERKDIAGGRFPAVGCGALYIIEQSILVDRDSAVGPGSI